MWNLSMFFSSRVFALPDYSWPLPAFQATWMNCFSWWPVAPALGRPLLCLIGITCSRYLSFLKFGLAGCPALSCGCKWHSSSPFAGWKIVLYYWNMVVDMIRISYFLNKLRTKGFMVLKKGRYAQVDEDVLCFVPEIVAKRLFSPSKRCDGRWASLPNSLE